VCCAVPDSRWTCSVEKPHEDRCRSYGASDRATDTPAQPHEHRTRCPVLVLGGTCCAFRIGTIIPICRWRLLGTHPGSITGFAAVARFPQARELVGHDLQCRPLLGNRTNLEPTSFRLPKLPRGGTRSCHLEHGLAARAVSPADAKRRRASGISLPSGSRGPASAQSARRQSCPSPRLSKCGLELITREAMDRED
jgi:hypothetical protein